MPKAKTISPVIPASVVNGFADVVEQAAAVLEALNRIDLDRADKLRTTVEVLTAGLDDDDVFHWLWDSGLHDFLDVMDAIKKLAASSLDSDTTGRFQPSSSMACTDIQVVELVRMARENSAERRRPAPAVTPSSADRWRC